MSVGAQASSAAVYFGTGTQAGSHPGGSSSTSRIFDIKTVSIKILDSKSLDIETPSIVSPPDHLLPKVKLSDVN